jgi:uncharacterized protein YaaW (UPF0174 family)
VAIGDQLDKLLTDPGLTQDDWEAFANILSIDLPEATDERRMLVSKEIRHNYGHSVRNVFREWFDPDYDEIVRATAKKLNIKVKDHHTLDEIEDRIVAELMDIAKGKIIKEKGREAWDKIENEIGQNIANLEESGSLPPGAMEQITRARSLGVMAALIGGRLAGFALYALANQTFFAIARFLGLGIGVAVAGPAIAAALAFLLGPAGWIVAVGLAAYDLGNTNWKKTIPAVLIVVLVRRRLQYEGEPIRGEGFTMRRQ